MITLIQLSWISLVVIFAFVNYKYCIATYLSYILLVPYLHLNIGGMIFQWNLINLIVLIGFFLNNKNTKIVWGPLYPFLFYFVSSLFMIFFQDGMPMTIQLDAWRAQFMTYLILPFVLYNYTRVDLSSIKLFRNVVLACISIFSLYGLVLTMMPGVNPYIMLLSQTNGIDFSQDYLLADGEGRLFGRITSVFSHPMTFGLMLGLSFFYVLHLRTKINRLFLSILLIIIVANILFCGVRSVIGGMIIAVIFSLLQTRRLKILLYSSIFLGVFYLVIINNHQLEAYVNSIGDIKHQQEQVKGSSIEMRIEQFDGCIKETKDCLFTGKGFSWKTYYQKIHGNHPIIRSFESLIFVILCESGLLGFVIWFIMGYLIFKYNKRKIPDECIILNSLYVFYIAYSTITGEYGYLQYFVLFYILVYSEKSIVRKLIIKQNENKSKGYSNLFTAISSYTRE